MVEGSHSNSVETAGARSTSGMKIFSLKQVLEDTSEPPLAIVSDGVLLDRTLLLISGPAKAGKSFLATNLGLAIAAKKNFAGFKIPAAQKVLMLSAEGGYYPNRDRLQRIGSGLPHPAEDNFTVWFDPRLDLTVAKDQSRLEEYLVRIRPKVLVIDPLIRFHNADENDANEMSGVFKSIHRLMSDYDLSVILVHHTGKNGSQGPRGSSVIISEYDSAISLTRDEDAHVLRFDMRHVETPPDRKVRFNTNTLWFEMAGVHKIAQVLLSSPGQRLDKKALADACVKEGFYKEPKNAYAAIDKAVDKGFLQLMGKVYMTKN